MYSILCDIVEPEKKQQSRQGTSKVLCADNLMTCRDLIGLLLSRRCREQESRDEPSRTLFSPALYLGSVEPLFSWSCKPLDR